MQTQGSPEQGCSQDRLPSTFIPHFKYLKIVIGFQKLCLQEQSFSWFLASFIPFSLSLFLPCSPLLFLFFHLLFIFSFPFFFSFFFLYCFTFQAFLSFNTDFFLYLPICFPCPTADFSPVPSRLVGINLLRSRCPRSTALVSLSSTAHDLWSSTAPPQPTPARAAKSKQTENKPCAIQGSTN